MKVGLGIDFVVLQALKKKPKKGFLIRYVKKTSGFDGLLFILHHHFLVFLGNLLVLGF